MAHPPGGLFAELNKGSDITKGLSHIDRHELKKQQESSAPSATGSATSTKPSASAVVKAEPKLVGDKWTLVRLIFVDI